MLRKMSFLYYTYFLTKDYKWFVWIEIKHTRPNKNAINYRLKQSPKAYVLQCAKLR